MTPSKAVDPASRREPRGRSRYGCVRLHRRYGGPMRPRLALPVLLLLLATLPAGAQTAFASANAQTAVAPSFTVDPYWPQPMPTT